MSRSVTFSFNLNVEVPNLNGDVWANLDVSLGVPRLVQHEVPSMVVYEPQISQNLGEIPVTFNNVTYMIPDSVATGRDIIQRETDMPRGWRPNSIILDDLCVPPKEKTNWLKEGF